MLNNGNSQLVLSLILSVLGAECPLTICISDWNTQSYCCKPSKIRIQILMFINQKLRDFFEGRDAFSLVLSNCAVVPIQTKLLVYQ